MHKIPLFKRCGHIFYALSPKVQHIRTQHNIYWASTGNIREREQFGLRKHAKPNETDISPIGSKKSPTPDLLTTFIAEHWMDLAPETER